MADKISAPGKGEALWGTTVFYAPYVEFGTRRSNSQPFLSTSAAIIKAKAAGEYKKGLGEAIQKSLSKKYKQVIAEGVEFVGVDLDIPVDNGNEEVLASLAIAAASQAKTLCPVDTGILRSSIMWRTSRRSGS